MLCNLPFSEFPLQRHPHTGPQGGGVRCSEAADADLDLSGSQFLYLENREKATFPVEALEKPMAPSDHQGV